MKWLTLLLIGACMPFSTPPTIPGNVQGNGALDSVVVWDDADTINVRANFTAVETAGKTTVTADKLAANEGLVISAYTPVAQHEMGNDTSGNPNYWNNEYGRELTLDGTHFVGDAVQVASTNATPFDLEAWSPVITNGVIEVEAKVLVEKTDHSAAAVYLLKGAFRVAASAVTQVGGTLTESFVDAGLATAACTLDTSAGNIRVRCTGIAATDLTWTAHVKQRNI